MSGSPCPKGCDPRTPPATCLDRSNPPAPRERLPVRACAQLKAKLARENANRQTQTTQAQTLAAHAARAGLSRCSEPHDPIYQANLMTRFIRKTEFVCILPPDCRYSTWIAAHCPVPGRSQRMAPHCLYQSEKGRLLARARASCRRIVVIRRG